MRLKYVKYTLSALLVVFGIFALGIYLSLGIFLGLAITLSVLFLVSKSPRWMKKLIVKYPFASDLILTSLATVSVAGFFGPGLTLGIGAVVAGIALSVILPMINEEETGPSKPACG